MDPDENIVPDAEDFDEGYQESMVSSYVSSIASDIRRGIEENGRVYPAYGKNQYGLPVDALEQERNDLQHFKYFLLLNDRLQTAPLPEAPNKILDLGCGSGIWAIDMADQYPSAQVIGVDIAPVQPVFVPINCEFQVDDVEQDWLFADNSFDLIHSRDLLFAVRDWERLIEQAKKALKPGSYLELNQSWPVPRCDDNTIPENSSYVEVLSVLADIGEAFGAPLSACTKFKDQMIAAGFVDVHEELSRIPITAWPKDDRLKKVGALEYENFKKGVGGWMLRGYTAMGRPTEEAQILAAKSRAELAEKGRSMHIWIPLFVSHSLILHS